MPTPTTEVVAVLEAGHNERRQANGDKCLSQELNVKNEEMVKQSKEQDKGTPEKSDTTSSLVSRAAPVVERKLRQEKHEDE